MTTRGIDIRQSNGRILFRASLKDADGNKVVSGTAELRLYRLNDDGTLDVLDWTTFAFVATGSGNPDDETTMTHRPRRDSSGLDVNTGIWTAVLSDLSGLTAGGVYIAQATHASAVPESQEREFQFGGSEGDAAQDIWTYGDRTLTQAAPEVTNPDGQTTELLRYRATRWTISITGLANLDARTALYFTVRGDRAAGDDLSLLQIEESDGLSRVNGEAYDTPAHGAIDVTSSTTLTVTVHEAVTSRLLAGTYHWDLKLITADGASVLTDPRAQIEIVDVVTQAIA